MNVICYNFACGYVALHCVTILFRIMMLGNRLHLLGGHICMCWECDHWHDTISLLSADLCMLGEHMH